MKLAIIAAVAAILIGLPMPCLAVSYTITDLGTLGGISSYGYAINQNGQVAGYASDENGSYVAFLFSGCNSHSSRGSRWIHKELRQVLA